MKKVTAVVLAGGRGKRMGVLCDTRPKPALPFGGNNRVIDFSLNNCGDSGIRNIIALVDYQRSYMSRYLKQWNFTNPLSQAIHVREPKKGSFRGTADAVYQNLDILNKTDAEAVLILAADHVYQMDYREMFDFHKMVGADVTVGVVPVPIGQAHHFGVVTADNDGRIIDFQEKPERPGSNLVSMGIYIFNTDVLARHLLKDALATDSSHDFGYSVIPRVIENEKVFANEFDGYWQDIGTPEAYHQAHMDLLNNRYTISLGSARPVNDGVDDVLRLAQIPKDNIRNSIISENCVVNGLVENSVLSPGVFVSENAIVRNAVVMAGSFIGYGSTICDCIIDEDVEIGDYAHVGPVTSFPAGRRQIHVLNRGMVIPSYANTGNNHQGIEKVDFSSVEADGLVLTRDFNNEDLLSIVQI